MPCTGRGIVLEVTRSNYRNGAAGTPMSLSGPGNCTGTLAPMQPGESRRISCSFALDADSVVVVQ
jgi:hypothetical protein